MKRSERGGASLEEGSGQGRAGKALAKHEEALTIHQRVNGERHEKVGGPRSEMLTRC